jgi:hypothetical protein
VGFTDLLKEIAYQADMAFDQLYLFYHSQNQSFFQL